MAYVDLTTRFVYKLATVFGDFNKLANNDKFMKENGWEDGTMGVFFQAAAPTGWTKNVTQNGRALRIVSGSGGGVGGATDPSNTISLAHTQTVSTDADHTHVIAAHTHHLATGGGTKANHGQRQPLGPNASQQLQPINTAVHTATFTSKLNQMPLSGSPITSAAGSHNHSGTTDSQLSDVTLAYANVIFCSKDTSTGYVDLSATFVHNVRHVFDYLSQLAGNDAFNYARRTPAGTVSVFYSAASPTGWTKQAVANAQLLRIVNDASGGSTGGTSDPANTITLAHTHGALASPGDHTHTLPVHTHILDDSTQYFSSGQDLEWYAAGSPITAKQFSGSPTTNVSPLKDRTTGSGSATSSAAGSHTHAIGSSLTDLSLAYVNVCYASKDSAGAPTAYTDYTAFFVDQALLAYQELQVMANNDAYLYFHTMPSSSVMIFFQAAAPFNWTKVTTQNDKLVRIVSGASGGSAGGSALTSSTITLAHTHTIDTQSHSHTVAHTHTMDVGPNQSNVANVGNVGVFGANGAELYRDATPGGTFDNSLTSTTDSQTPSTDTYSHNHGGATGSALANVSLAYADVIACSKN